MTQIIPPPTVAKHTAVRACTDTSLQNVIRATVPSAPVFWPWGQRSGGVGNTSHLRDRRVGRKHDELLHSEQTVDQSDEAIMGALLKAVYGRLLNHTEIYAVVQICPELPWIVQCTRESPLAVHWERDCRHGGYVSTLTAERRQMPPHLPTYAELAGFLIRARTEPQHLSRVISSIRQVADEMMAKVDSINASWTGPHIDPSSGAGYYYCAVAGQSMWEHPAAMPNYLAQVANRLLDVVEENNGEKQSFAPPSRPRTSNSVPHGLEGSSPRESPSMDFDGHYINSLIPARSLEHSGEAFASAIALDGSTDASSDGSSSRESSLCTESRTSTRKLNIAGDAFEYANALDALPDVPHGIERSSARESLTVCLETQSNTSRTVEKSLHDLEGAVEKFSRTLEDSAGNGNYAPPMIAAVDATCHASTHAANLTCATEGLATHAIESIEEEEQQNTAQPAVSKVLPNVTKGPFRFVLRVDQSD